MKYSKGDVAAMVTMYNSSPDVIENIATYINQVDKLYVIDNSENTDATLQHSLKSFRNLCYLPNNNNLGIGYALNRAANKALEDGYCFLLTMDDDSKSPADLVEKMLSFIDTQHMQTIGIISVNHSIGRRDIPFLAVRYTMTSGNLLNLDAYREVGPFSDQLFIDHVDHEYGMRLNMNQFRVIELGDIQLIHTLGVKKQIKVLNELYSFVSHSPLRMYYMARNGIYVAVQYRKQYPTFLLTALKLTTKEIIKAILFEDQKILRLQNIFQGIRDGLYSHLGRIDKSKIRNDNEYAN